MFISHYPLVRDALFKLPAETSHDLALKLLRLNQRLGLTKNYAASLPSVPIDAMGMRFKNPVGLAAGLDKNGEYIDALSELGFGFIEVGTVTPKAQAGNSQPRLFRIPTVEGIVNRMGFNNLGIDNLVQNVLCSRLYKENGVIGVNIGKNATTSLDNAVEDYSFCLKKAYVCASYIVVNLSSPNTPGLRDLQTEKYFSNLLRRLVSEREKLKSRYGKRVPLLVKVTPDVIDEEIRSIAKTVIAHEIDGVVLTNTTVKSNPSLLTSR